MFDPDSTSLKQYIKLALYVNKNRQFFWLHNFSHKNKNHQIFEYHTLDISFFKRKKKVKYYELSKHISLWTLFLFCNYFIVQFFKVLDISKLLEKNPCLAQARGCRQGCSWIFQDSSSQVSKNRPRVSVEDNILGKLLVLAIIAISSEFSTLQKLAQVFRFLFPQNTSQKGHEK